MGAFDGEQSMAPRASPRRLTQTRVAFSLSVTVMFRNPADGLCADRAPGTVGAARRRRDRRLRAFLKHERLAVAMNLATIQHHSHMKSAVVDVCVQVGSPLAPVTDYVAPAPAVSYAAPAPVFEYVAPALAVTYAAPAPVVDYVAPAPAVTCAAPAPVIEYVAPAPAVTYAAPAPVIEYVAPAPVMEYIALAPAVTHAEPSLQLRPAYSAATVATGVNLDVTGFVSPQFSRTAVEGSASQVVVPLPPSEEFTEPVCNQVHRERFSASELPENIADIPVVLEQEIVQAPFRVADSSPPCEVFVAPVFDQVHQVQFAAGETSENFANIPVVQEQLLVQATPRFVGLLPPVQEFTAYVARRPSPLVEVRPSERAQQHAVEGLPWCRSSMPLCRRWWTMLRKPYGYLIDRLPSRLSQCPQFLALRVRRVHEFLSRSQRISWWKFRLFCLPRASLCRSRSRLSPLQSLVAMFMVLSQDRVPPFLFPSPLSGWSSATPTAGPTFGTVALKRSFGRLRVASGLSGLE